MTKIVGFIGLGDMGMPMALRLVETGSKLVVWTRNAAKLDRFQGTSATVAASPRDVFAKSDVIVTMLATSDVLDQVLERNSADFATMCGGKTIVQMGTTLPA